MAIQGGSAIPVAVTDDRPIQAGPAQPVFVTNADVRAQAITFRAVSNAHQAWSDMPAALTELFGQTAGRLKMNLTGYTEARVVVKTATAGATNAALAVQYSTDQTNWNYLDGSTGPSVGIGTANSVQVGAWVSIALAARGDVFLRCVGRDGDGAADPTLGSIFLQVR